MTFLGLDLGGTHAACSLISGQTVLATEHLPFTDTLNFAAVLPDVTATLKKLSPEAPEPVSGLGIGMCGLVDSRRNRVLSTNGKYEDTVSFDFERWGRESLGVPVRLENDARLALRGEMYAGAARGFSDVVMFTLGTGIGGVAAMGGVPLTGAHGQAGVLGGHVSVQMNGRKCTCGGQGCAEAEASGWSLPMLCRESPGFAQSRLADLELNFKNLFESCTAGDPVALDIRTHCLTVWGMMTVTAIHSFDPELIVFGGGAMGAASQILPTLQHYVEQNTWTPWGKVRVVPAELGSHAAALGVPTLFPEGAARHV
jgi:glucokinase